jgi:hypothetical protein
MDLQDVPGRVFLDTCVVNFMLDHGAEIHENVAPPQALDDRSVEDIQALRNLVVTGQRAQWQLAVSPFTYSEIARTRNLQRLADLDLWFQELWQYWRSIVDSGNDLPSFVEAEDMRVRLLTSGHLTVLPDVADRVLICDAFVYRCDLFCTRDWTTILRHRGELTQLPFQIVTPSEWWERIQAFAALWA